MRHRTTRDRPRQRVLVDVGAMLIGHTSVHVTHVRVAQCTHEADLVARVGAARRAAQRALPVGAASWLRRVEQRMFALAVHVATVDTPIEATLHAAEALDRGWLRRAAS